MSELQGYGSLYAKHNLQSNRSQAKESPSKHHAQQSGNSIVSEKQCAQETNRRRKYQLLF